MKALIVDDEPLARERLSVLLRQCADVEIVGEASDGRRAVEQAQALAPDVVLLDVRMPVMDGIEAARHMSQLDEAPAVILCTAYDEHALAAFDAGAVDYLVKPVRAERLREALDRARRYTRSALAGIATSKGQPTPRSHLCARVRGNLKLIPLADIEYLQAEDKYIVVHHADGEVLIEETLKALESEFAEHFVRVHRNCLVARDKLAGLVRGSDGIIYVQMSDSGDALEVSRRNLPALRKLVRSL